MKKADHCRNMMNPSGMYNITQHNITQHNTTQHSITIDQHRDEEGRPLPEYDESIWYVGMEYY